MNNTYINAFGKVSLLLLTFVMAFSGCKKEPDYSDAVFITGTLGSNTVNFSVDGQSSVALTVSSSAKAVDPVSVKISAAPELLDQYNKLNNRSYQIPPAESWSLDGQEVTISSGKSVSSQIVLTANSDDLEDGIPYCLPVTITSVDGGGLGILESSRTAYIMFKKVITTKVAEMKGNSYFNVPSLAGESSPVWALKQMTLEIKVKPYNLTSQISSSAINPVCGSHESLLLRFGDGSMVPGNKLNFAKVSIGSNYHPDNKPHYETNLEETFESNTWYHVAVTYDGTSVRFYLNGHLEIEKKTEGGEINLAMSYGGHGWDDTFAIGRSYGTAWTYKGCVSECRIWTVARSQAQIQDGICYVAPDSEGLEAYWRFNGEVQEDGSVLDETGHGHKAEPHGTITWPDNQKCPF